SPTMGRLEVVDDRTCRLETGGHSLDSLAAWILHIGVDFEVTDPPELCERLRFLGDRMLRAAGAATVPR
ncbi:MAG TPA: WYL domain-containing protein, partial [Polyangiaceae bacterium]|nr:WYL domain-containing protein [Polyangiaceae bacterium]